MRRPGKCPTPDKAKFMSKQAAENVLRRPMDGEGLVKPIRAYLCPCGSYHLTARCRRRHGFG